MPVNAQAWLFPRHFVEFFGCVVFGAVVDIDDFIIRNTVHRGTDFLNQRADVFTFVVDGHDDSNFKGLRGV